MKKTRPQQVFTVFNYIFLTMLGVLCVLPLLNIIALSFSSRNMVNARMVTFWPKQFTVSSYAYMLEKSGLVPAVLITLKRVVLGLVVNMLMTIVVAYPLSKTKEAFRSRKYYVGFFLFTMIFNGGLIPTYLVVKELRMLDTIWVLILPNAVTMYYVLLMLNFFRGLPSSTFRKASSVYAAPRESRRIKRLPAGGFTLICAPRFTLHPASSSSCMSASKPSGCIRRALSIIMRIVSRLVMRALPPCHLSYETVLSCGFSTMESRCSRQRLSLNSATTLPERSTSLNLWLQSSETALNTM